MKEQKYINIINKYSKLILVLLVLIVMFIFVITLKSINNKDDDKVKVSYDNLNSFKDVIKYYESTYISEKLSTEKDFSYDVYLKFKVLPYEKDNTSNEQYYNDLLGDCAKVNKYNSFILIDEENELTVKVICNGRKIISIIINDIEDYFIYMDSKISLEEYEEIEITQFEISSEILQNCIDNDWNTNIDFGSRDSIFEGYDIYFDEGIKSKVIDNKIFNIIFTTNYNGNVINSFFPGIDLDTVESILGNPTFKDNETKVIGYKGEKIYAFFSENEISLYKVSKADADEFFDLADKYINEELDLLDFMNELTYIWPDYSEYDYDTNYVFLSYPMKGIEIKVNYDDMNGFLVYNNISSNFNKVSRYLENTNFVSRLKVDLVFETEKRRIKKRNDLENLAKEYNANIDEEEAKIIGNNINYYVYPIKDSNNFISRIKFISRNVELPDRELSDNVSQYLWVSSNRLIYSKANKGIFSYNMINGYVERILTGKDAFELKGYEDNILRYDDKELELYNIIN